MEPLERLLVEKTSCFNFTNNHENVPPMNHGSHWHAIFDDDESIMTWIPQMLTHGHLGQQQPEDAPGKTRFRYLVGADQSLTGTGIIRLGEDCNEYVSGFPTLLDFAENELEMVGCTIFTGRKGHIELIQNLSADQRSAAQVS